MTDRQIIEKIAYCYYLKFKRFGQPEDRGGDWRYAERAYTHLISEPNPTDYWYDFHETDYGEFRKFLEENRKKETHGRKKADL